MSQRPPVVHRIESSLLANNPLGDPRERDIYVYLPPGHHPAKPIPALMALAGFTGSGPMLFNLDPMGEPLGARIDRLIADGTCPPVAIVAPDCFTRLGGNQYLDSSAIGPYASFLVREVVPFIETKLAVSRWGVFGKSSGGYGAMVLGMLHSETFSALADHSGDSNFELCYLADFAQALDQFRSAGGPQRWLDAYWASSQRKRSAQVKALNVLAMAASYSPNPASPHMGIDFPFDLENGRFIPEVWDRWRAWDPVTMVKSHVANLAKHRLLYVDCGTRDEFGLHWGARALVGELRHRGLEVVSDEFDDGHMNVTYRFDRSIPLLAKALSAP